MEHSLADSQRPQLSPKWIGFAFLCALYILLFVLLCQTPLYSIEGAHNDRLFSADDIYYTNYFFSTTMDESPRIVKHPLLIVFGWLFTCLESTILGPISLRHHYELIVLLQLCVSLVSVLYLYKILDEFYHLRPRHTVLLCAIYALSFSTLFYTFIAESYINSSCILLMSYYYARRKNSAAVVLLGVLAAGVTITNAFLWAIIVFATSTQSLKKRLALLVLGGVCFCLAVALSPAGRIFFQDTLAVCFGSAENYSDHFPLLTMLRYAFFIFFGSTFFFVDTQNATPFGDYPGDALSFLPSAPPLIVAAMAFWCAVLIAAVIKGRRDPLLLAPLGVLIFNLLLHGALQYGLKEGFLYSLHHLSAQLLIAALLLRPKEQPAGTWDKIPPIALSVFLLCEILLNLPGYFQLVHYIGG